MIDRETRDWLAQAIRDALHGQELPPGIKGSSRMYWEDKGAGAVQGFARRALARTHQPDGRKRRRLERCVLFLATDQEYRWDGFGLITTAVVACLVMFCLLVPLSETQDAFENVLMACCIVVVPYAAYWVAQKIGGMNRSYWPFFRRADYERALAETESDGDRA